MATGAAEMMFQCVFDGSLAVHDIGIERRPYHRNCGCALHKLKGVCSTACSQKRNISFPKKQAWSDCSSSMAASKISPQSSLPGDSSVRRRENINGVCHIDDGNMSKGLVLQSIKKQVRK